MTDRHSGYVVTLEKDMRADDAQATIIAIQQIKGVIAVDPHIASVGDMIAEARAERAFKDKLIETFFPQVKP